MNNISILSIPLLFLTIYLLNSKSYTRTPLTEFIYPILLGLLFSLLAIKLEHIKNYTGKYNSILIEMGRLSFSMYIIHFFLLDIVQYIFNNVLNKFIFLNEIQLIIFFFAVLILTFNLSKFTNIYIEKNGIKIGNYIINKFKIKTSI